MSGEPGSDEDGVDAVEAAPVRDGVRDELGTVIEADEPGCAAFEHEPIQHGDDSVGVDRAVDLDFRYTIEDLRQIKARSTSNHRCRVPASTLSAIRSWSSWTGWTARSRAHSQTSSAMPSSLRAEVEPVARSEFGASGFCVGRSGEHVFL